MGKKNKGMTAFLLPLNKECLLNRLTDEEVGRLFRHLYAYANRNELPEETENSSILVSFDCFTAYIDDAKTAYEKKVNDGKKAIQKRWGKDAEEHQSIDTYTDLPSPISKDSNLYQRIGEDTKTKTKTKTILSERETPPTPSKGKGGDSSSLLTKAKNLFRKSYEEIEGKPYAWTKKDERAMESLIGKLQYCYSSSTDKEILNRLDSLVENSVCNQWVSENLSVSIIDLKFNEINKLLNA